MPPISSSNASEPPTSLTIIIPTLKWEGLLWEALREITRYCHMRGFDYEIIVVVDGDFSTSLKLECRAQAPRLRVIHHERRMGKGFAVKQGVLAASKPYVLYTDTDLSVPVDEIEKFLRVLDQGYDLAIASRRVQGAQVLNRPMRRRLMTCVLNWFIRHTLFRGIRDTQCGFKCLRTDVAQDLFRDMRLRGFSFDIELLGLAKHKRYRIAEVPVCYTHHRYSTIRPIRDSLLTLTDVLKLAVWKWTDEMRDSAVISRN